MKNNILVYPEILWKEVDEGMSVRVHKNSLEYQREILEGIRKKLGKHVEGWYELSGSVLRKHGGGIVLQRYSSYYKCIITVYPEVDWDVLRFNTKPRNFWQNIENQRLLMKELERKFQITHPKDWLNMNVDVFRRQGGLSLFRLYPSFLHLLKASTYDNAKVIMIELIHYSISK